MPPLGLMQKKIRVSEQIVAWGCFSLELGLVQVLAIAPMWTETDLHKPSYPLEPVPFAPSGHCGYPGGVALRTRTYLALMVLLEVILKKIALVRLAPMWTETRAGALDANKSPSE
jgi:hypothetical protein